MDKQMSMEELAEEVYAKDSQEYNAFVDKFKPKRTTDDCFTPEPVYQAVAGWVEKEYGVSEDKFVRPFYPGGDYKAYEYPEGCVVVDNPPFSILAEIVKWYAREGIRFFLFAPALTILGLTNTPGVCAVCAYGEITYENGANVKTSFVTNMQGDVVARSAPGLCAAIKCAMDEINRQSKKQLPKYAYDEHVLMASDLNKMAKYGVEYEVRREEAHFTRGLDSQKKNGKAMYGAGFLISERAAAERAAAERAAAERANAEVWELSERERKIVRELSAC